MRKYSLNELLGNSEPLLEVEIGDRIFKLFKTSDIAEKYRIQLLEANVKFAETSEMIETELTTINSNLKVISEEIKKSKSKSSSQFGARLRVLDARKSYLQSLLVTPARYAIEAMFQVDRDTLSFLSPELIEVLYKEINDVISGQSESQENVETESKK